MNNISVKDYPSNPNITEEGLDENHTLKKMLRLIGENKGSPVPMVIKISNQRSKLVAVRESCRSLQSHKLAV